MHVRFGGCSLENPNAEAEAEMVSCSFDKEQKHESRLNRQNDETLKRNIHKKEKMMMKMRALIL